MYIGNFFIFRPFFLTCHSVSLSLSWSMMTRGTNIINTDEVLLLFSPYLLPTFDSFTIGFSKKGSKPIEGRVGRNYIYT